MGLSEQITLEVKGITDLMDDIIEKVQNLKSEGVDVTARQDFQTKVRGLYGVVGVTASADVTDATETASRKRLTEDETKSIDGVITGIISGADKKTGIHITKLKEHFENDPLIKANGWQDKLQARLSKMKNDKSVKYEKGKTNKEGGTFFSK